VRVAWCADVGGLPLEPAVRAVMADARERFVDAGAHVEDVALELRDADLAFEALRALGFVRQLGEYRNAVKDAIVWNIEQGLALDGPRIARAMTLRSEIFGRMRRFLERYDFLVLPVNQVPPFPVTQPYPDAINGQRLGTYIEWMKTAYYITVTSHPAISVPAGFTDDATPLPVGLQIVGRYREDFEVLRIAHTFEAATRVGERRPPIA
jgi:amidase